MDQDHIIKWTKKVEQNKWKQLKALFEQLFIFIYKSSRYRCIC